MTQTHKTRKGGLTNILQKNSESSKPAHTARPPTRTPARPTLPATII